MNINEAIETQEFFEKMREEQAIYVVRTTAPIIAEYFEGLKFKENDKYKEMVLEFIRDMGEAESKEGIVDVLNRYKEIVDDYKKRIKKIERGDKDIRLMDGNIERTKELIKPISLICGFVDNLIYGNYNKEQIQQYFSIWQEKSNINPLEPADFIVSSSGRHVNLAYKEDTEEQEK